MPIEPSGLYDKSFQVSLLAHLVRSRSLLRYLLDGRVDSADFPLGIHKAIINAAIQVLRTSGQVLPENGVALSTIMIPLRGMITAGIVYQEEIDALCGTIHEIYAMQLNSEYFEGALSGYLLERRSIAASKEAGNDPQALINGLTRAVESSRTNRSRGSTPLSRVSIGAPEETIPSGLAAIDSPMRGGLGRKRAGMIIGFTGLGKTALGLNFGWGAARQGYRSRFYSLELPMDEIDKRVYALVARYSYDMIQFGDRPGGLTREQIEAEVDERVRQEAGGVMDNFRVSDFSTETATAQMIEEDLIQDEQEGRPTDMVMIDWLECLELPPAQKNAKFISQIPIKELRHKLEKIASDLVEVAVRRNVAMWILTQSDFDAEGKSKIGLKNKSEAKGVSRKMSWVLGMGMSETEREGNIVTVTAAKARNGRAFTCHLRRALHEQRFESLEAGEELLSTSGPATDQALQLAGFA